MSDTELTEEKYQMDFEDDGYAPSGETMEMDVPGTEHEFIHVPSIKCEVDPEEVVLEDPTHFAPDDPLNCHFMLASEEPSSSHQVVKTPENNEQQTSDTTQNIQVFIRRASGAVSATPMRIPKDGDIMTHLMSRINTKTSTLAQNVKIVVQNTNAGTMETFYYKSPREKSTYCEVEGCSWSTNASDPDHVLVLLNRHLSNSHRNMNMCKYCTNLFETRQELTQHINKFHVTYVCSNCNTRFDANRELCYHQLKCRNIPETNLPVLERTTTITEKCRNIPETNLPVLERNTRITEKHRNIPETNLHVLERTTTITEKCKNIPETTLPVSERNATITDLTKGNSNPQKKRISILKSSQPTKLVCTEEKERRKALIKTYSCKIDDCFWSTCIRDRKLALWNFRCHVRVEHPLVSMCICLELYPSKSSLMRHITKCKKLYSCHLCSMTFSKAQEWYVHYYIHHGHICYEDMEITEPKPLTCCNKNCTWRLHDSPLKDDLLQRMTLHSICEHGTVNICDICLVMFNDNQQLLLHFVQNHDKFRCTYCPREFDTREALTAHSNRFHSKTVASDHDCSTDDDIIVVTPTKASSIEVDVVSIASSCSENEEGDYESEIVASTSSRIDTVATTVSPTVASTSSSRKDTVATTVSPTVASTLSRKDTVATTVSPTVASTLIRNDTVATTVSPTVASTSSNNIRNKIVVTTVASTPLIIVRKSVAPTVALSSANKEAVASTLGHREEYTSSTKYRTIKSPSSLIHCQLCEYATDGTNLKNAVYNMKNHTSVYHSKSHLCELCFSLFSTKKELTFHSVQAHFTHSCQHCRSKFTNEDDLQIHRVKYHENATVSSRVTTRTRAAEISLNGIVKTPNNEKPSNNLTWCSMPDCMWSTDATEPEEILTNIKCHASFVHDKHHVCDYCYSLFDISTHCLDHIKQTHLKSCNICTYKYVTPEKLNDHLIHVHTVPNNVPVTQESEDRNEHRLASGTFMCKICNSKLNDYDKFKAHCIDCHLVPSDLNINKIKNKDCLVYKKYHCKKCFTSTKSLSKLRQHLTTYHGLFSVNPTILVGGIKILYPCPFKKRICALKKWTTSRELLKEHFRTYHDLTDDEFPPIKSTFFYPSDWYTTKIIEQPVTCKYKSRYECHFCLDFFPTLYDIQDHFKVKHGKYRCSKCLAMFDSDLEQVEHEQQVHIANCKLCDFTAIKHQSMMNHMTKSHSDVDPSYWWDIQSTSTSDFACKLCTQTFSSALNAKMHYFFYHTRYVCEFCWLSFNLSSQEEQHFKQNHLTECRHCHSKFQCQEDLMSHLEAEHPEDRGPLCESCGEYVIDRETLLEHRTDHGKPLTVVKKPWEVSALCNLCGATVRSQKALDQHMASKHTENDQRSGDFCKICNKQFKSIQIHMYKTHGAAPIKTMNKEMKFKCPHCPKRFSSYFDLKRHLPRHSKYTCNLCPMQFSYLPNLEEHVTELHNNPYAYSCGICHKVFPSNSDFQIHMGFHSPNSRDENPKLLPYFRCQLCEHFCLSHDAIKKHIETGHIRGRKLVNVKRCKPKGRAPYLKRV